MFWGTVTKALQKSIQMTAVAVLFFTDTVIRSQKATKLALPLVELSWCPESPLCPPCVSTQLPGGSVPGFPGRAETPKVRLMGHKFLACFFLLFLKMGSNMGAIFPFFQSPGTLPDFHDFAGIMESKYPPFDLDLLKIF